MSSPYGASGKNGISVADAKAYIATIDPDGIADQITHYTTVATSLNNLAQAITTINNNLQSTWSGSAADAANSQFGTVATNTSTLASVVSDQIVPALKDAHAGAQSAQKQIKGVQDEVTQVNSSVVTRGSVSTGITPKVAVDPVVASQASTPPANMNESMTYEQALTYNTQQRTAAANAMNAVAVPYAAGSSTFNSVSVGLSHDATTSPPPAATGFTLTTTSGGGSASNGTANGYQSHLGSGGSSGSGGSGGSGGSTKIQGYVPPPPMPTPTAPPPPPGTVPPTSPPVVIPPTDPVVTSPPPGGDPITDPPGGTTPVTGNPTGSDPVVGTDPVTGLPIEGAPGIGTGSGSGSPGVFGEGGLPGGTSFGEGSLAGGTGSGIVPGGTNFGGPAAASVSETGVVGGTPTEGSTGAAQSAEQPGMGMMGGMRGGGGGGGGSTGGGSGGPSAAYLRGRYLGDDETATGYASAPWESPAIGGSESVLIGAQPAEGAGVTSVYTGAQDSNGNPVGMMGGGGLGASRSYGEESEESGPRPSYVKEDPQWWTPEGSYVPPVVE